MLDTKKKNAFWQIMFTFFFSLVLYIMLLLSSFIFFFSFHFYSLSHYFPIGTPLLLFFILVPLEILVHFIRPLSLSLRLAANLTAGHLLYNISLSYLLPMLFNLSFYFVGWAIFFFSLFILLEILVVIIQAYVFLLLITVYNTELHSLH